MYVGGRGERERAPGKGLLEIFSLYSRSESSSMYVDMYDLFMNCYDYIFDTGGI